MKNRRGPKSPTPPRKIGLIEQFAISRSSISNNCFSLGNESLWTYSGLAGTSLTVRIKRLTLKVKGFKLFIRLSNPTTWSVCSISIVLK